MSYPVFVFSPRLFALVIGINTYKSKHIIPLRGAIADAQAVAEYLFNQLHVPRDQVVVLKNEAASRVAILDELFRLANDPRIQRGDPIFVFYAGYGSEAPAPQAWAAGGSNAKIQLILPYDVGFDSGDEVAPIPDRTLGALLEAIYQKKGNNISVVMDCCFSGSSTRSSSASSNIVRFEPPPSNFKLQEHLDQEIWSLFTINGGLRSHVLLSACSSSGQAWESDGRGVFTAALLNLLENSQIDRLRYCDIILQLDVDFDFRQNPRCEGLYRERYLFSTESSLIQYFIPAYTRSSKNGETEYVLNGGAAHGLHIGDEFAVYGRMNSSRPTGTLVVQQLGPFYSIMEPLGPAFPLGFAAIASQVKHGRRQPFLIYISPADNVSQFLSLLGDSPSDLPDFVIVDNPGKSQIDISMQGDHAIVRSRGMSATQGFRIEPTPSELARVLKSSWRFFSELNRTADCSDITKHVQVDVHELQMSPTPIPGTPIPAISSLIDVPYETDSLIFREGSTYGLKLTNNSPFDLYPTVQYFDSSNEFKYDTLYRPGCGTDVPLAESGGTLTVGYGSGGSPPLVVPASEGSGFLKISLYSRSPDPLSDAHSFRLAHYLRDNVKGPWATITKRVVYRPSKSQNPFPNAQQPFEEFTTGDLTTRHVDVSRSNAKIDHTIQKPSFPPSLVPDDGQGTIPPFLDLTQCPMLWWPKSPCRLSLAAQAFLVPYIPVLQFSFAQVCQGILQVIGYILTISRFAGLRGINAKNSNYTHTWSISAATSIAWVIIAFVFTIIDYFSQSAQATLDTNGGSVGSLWLWLLPVVVGWLLISPKCDSNRLREAVDTANSSADFAMENSSIPCEAISVSGMHAISLQLANADEARRDERSTAPIFNYARFLPWVEAVMTVSDMDQNVSERHQNRDPVVDGTDGEDRKSGHPVHATAPELEKYCSPRSEIVASQAAYSRRRWGLDESALCRMRNASLLALMLQWGTAGAAVIIVWFTPTVGLGCRSASYIVYGIVSIWVWMMLLTSSILTYYSINTATDSREENSTTPSQSRISLARFSIFLRRFAKIVAALNAVWMVATGILQFSGTFDRYYCNNSVFELGQHTYNVIS